MKDVLLHSVKEFGNREFTGNIMIKKVQKNGEEVEEREIQKFTYKEIFEKANALGSFLL